MASPPFESLDVPGRAVWLRRDAEKIGGSLPPLLAEAERLAATIALGVHGRRRPGMGEEFWQYRQAMPGDTASDIDWRRSGRSDTLFIRQMEWSASQTVSIWADDARSMDYKGDRADRTKAERARLLTLALSVLLSGAGERIALMGTRAEQPGTGENHLRRIALTLSDPAEDRKDYGAPPRWPDRMGGQAVLLSDFMGDADEILAGVGAVADHGITGALVQILDDSEEDFPFDGRTLFQSVGGTIDFETQRARALREAYHARLRERRALLEDIARRTGWHLLVHHTSESPRKALLWLYTLLRGGE
ncbi:MAG: DUF58 domain-containing protein [Pseudomonadota bacterium]